jgi:PII-like signaling protein
MKGFQISFFTVQNAEHDGKRVTDWLFALVKELGLTGVTEISAQQGIGHHRKLHSTHFIELADQPIEVMIAATEEQSVRLFERLKAAKVKIFYIKAAVEFGNLGES